MPISSDRCAKRPSCADSDFLAALAEAIEEVDSDRCEPSRYRARIDQLEAQMVGQVDAQGCRILFQVLVRPSDIENEIRLGADLNRELALAKDRLPLWLRAIGLDLLSLHPSAWAQRLLANREVVANELLGWARTERAWGEIGSPHSERSAWEPWKWHLFEYPENTCARLRAYAAKCIELRRSGTAEVEREIAALECAETKRGGAKTYAAAQQEAQSAALGENLDTETAARYARRKVQEAVKNNSRT